MLTRRLSIAALALAAGCGKRSDELQVGAYLSLSGTDATLGTDARDGIELAVAEVNAAGGVKGKKVKVLYEDDKSTTQDASAKVRQLIDRDKVVAILGDVTSSRSIAGALIANTSHVPMITPSSTAIEVTPGRDWVFRTCFDDDQQGVAAARFLHDELKKNKVGVLYAAQDTAAWSIARSFRDEFKRLGGAIAIDKGYPKGDTNFAGYLSEIKAANPDMIFVPSSYGDMIQVARQAKQLGIPGSMIMGRDGTDSASLVAASGAELDGAYFTAHFAPDAPSPSSTKFVAAFSESYKHPPSSADAQGYDAARVLFDAMSRATEVTPDAIRNAIAETKNVEGATGTMAMDNGRNTNKPIVIVKITNKKLTYASQIAVSDASAPAALSAPPASTLDQTVGNPDAASITAATAVPSTMPSDVASAFPPGKPGSVIMRAIEASKAGRSAEVRRLLEAKVRSGHGTGDEVRLVREACKSPYDKACVDDIKQKYP